MKAIVTLFTVAFVITFGMALISQGVAAQSNGNDSNDAWYSDGPTVLFYLKNETSGQWIELKSENPVFYKDTENVTLKVHVGGPSYVANSIIESENGIVRWWMGYLTSVSYKAGWQYNRNVQVYTNTSNDGEKSLDFELTNIPNYGKHTLEVEASCVVFVFGGGADPVYFSGHHSYLEFTVAPYPTATPESTPTTIPMAAPVPLSPNFNLEQAMTIVVVIVAVAVLAVGMVVLWRKVNTRGTN